MNIKKQTDLTAIVGLGKTGLACAQYLKRQGIPIAMTDTRDEPPGLTKFRAQLPDVPVSLGGLDKKLLASAREIIVSPGLPLSEPALAECIAQGKSIISDVELFARHAKAPICAITGSNAKSTVTSLLADMARYAGLEVRVGGNIGKPTVELLKAHEPDCYVLELSSFQLETTYSLKPIAATILNICEDHLDRYKNLEEYINTKQRIYQNAETIVSNRDDDNTYPRKFNSNLNISFGFTAPHSGEFGLLGSDAGIYLSFGDELLLSVNELYIKGRHNWGNALAALALGYAMKLPMSAMLQALQNFKGLPHRCQWIANSKGINWYNDSKGTNVGAALAAIEGLGSGIDGKILLIAGGLGKNADFSELSYPVKNFARCAILIGKDAKKIGKALGSSTEIIYSKTLEEAVKIAHTRAEYNDAVLLSPACASFDMFANFEHRGEMFVKAVKEELQ